MLETNEISKSLQKHNKWFCKEYETELSKINLGLCVDWTLTFIENNNLNNVNYFLLYIEEHHLFLVINNYVVDCLTPYGIMQWNKDNIQYYFQYFLNQISDDENHEYCLKVDKDKVYNPNTKSIEQMSNDDYHNGCGIVSYIILNSYQKAKEYFKL